MGAGETGSAGEPADGRGGSSHGGGLAGDDASPEDRGGAAGAPRGEAGANEEAGSNRGGVAAVEVGGSGGEGGGTSDVGKVMWLGDCTPVDLSKDGKTVLAKEGIWTEANGWQTLPDLPGGAVANDPRALSRDGQVVFGLAGSALGLEAYRWTAAGGIAGLGVTHVPFAADLDGSTMVGWTVADADIEPFRWTQADGAKVLALFPGYDINEIGALLNDAGDQAYFSQVDSWLGSSGRWTAANGFAGDFGGRLSVTAASADGNKVALYGGLEHNSYLATGGCLLRVEGGYGQPPLGTPESCERADGSDDGAFVYLSDYDDAAEHGVGFEWVLYDESEPVKNFYWSRLGGMRPLAEVLPVGSGIQLRVTEQVHYQEFVSLRPHSHLSGDGRLLLGQDATKGCFLAEIAERTLCDGCSGKSGQLDSGPTDDAVEWLGPCFPLALNDDGTKALATRGLWQDGVGWLQGGTLPMRTPPASSVDLSGKCLNAALAPSGQNVSCASYDAFIVDYSTDGTRGVGYEYFMGDLDRPFFWSASGGMVLLDPLIAGGHDELAYPGSLSRTLGYDDPDEGGHVLISGDGEKVLSRDEHGSCFIAKVKLP